MGESYLFVILLALTLATVGAVLVQVLFGLLEVKKRRLQERLGAAPETQYESYAAWEVRETCIHARNSPRR